MSESEKIIDLNKCIEEQKQYIYILQKEIEKLKKN